PPVVLALPSLGWKLIAPAVTGWPPTLTVPCTVAVPELPQPISINRVTTNPPAHRPRAMRMNTPLRVRAEDKRSGGGHGARRPRLVRRTLVQEIPDDLAAVHGPHRRPDA